eukprot:gene12101-13351_t
MVLKNGVYIVQGELNHVIAALRRSNRWSGGHYHQDQDQDPLLNSFSQLKETLQSISDITEIDANIFLGPFLDVIRSEDTTGPITGVALSSVNKFLCYGLIDPTSENSSSGVENLADAVTHARFVGTDPSSDEVVLMKILQVLRTLLLSSVGIHMTNESVCEIMQSCFRICFEMRLSELLRRTAEQTLVDMVQLLFTRLPQFKEDVKGSGSSPHIRKLFKRSGALSGTRRPSKKPSPLPKRNRAESSRKSSRNSANNQNINTLKSELEENMTTTTTEDTACKDNKLGQVDCPDVTQNEVAREGAESSSDGPEQMKTVSIAISGPVEVAKNEDQFESEVEESKSGQRKESVTDTSEAKESENEVAETSVRTEVVDGIATTDLEGTKGGDLVENKSCEDLINDAEDSETFRDINDFKPEITETEENQPENELSIEMKKSDMSGLVSKGVISLQYPDDDVRSMESLNLSEETAKEEKLEVKDEATSDEKASESVVANEKYSLTEESGHSAEEDEHEGAEEYVNQQGVRFMPQQQQKEGHATLIPYGLPCVRELLRFLTTLINPHDRHNSNTMIHIGLSLMTVAFESGSSKIGHFSSLMNQVKDETCKNLLSLLQCDIHILFSLAMRVCFLMMEALRSHLKYQVETFFIKLMDILVLEHINIPYEKREMTLEYINQLFHIPYLVPELYLNYDCDIRCTNLLEDFCKVLSKNAFRPGNLSTVNMLALDALLTVVNEIEENSHRISSRTESDSVAGRLGFDDVTGNNRTISTSSEKTGEDDSGSDDNMEYLGILPPAPPTSGFSVAKQLLAKTKQTTVAKRKPRTYSEMSEVSLPCSEDLSKQKRKKKLLWQGIEEFNKKAKKGIEFLQEHGLISIPLVPEELVSFFKENQKVDKKIIGEYIGSRSNSKVLDAFVRSFDMKGLGIGTALRHFLETFRLPGESPVISLILEHFAEIYYEANRENFANTDAVFTLAYAVIMLNVDQHNANVKQQKSMTVDEFKRNVRGVNGGGDFPAEMIEELYISIKNEEIVMPSERTGKVKENYDWKVLIRKSQSPDCQFLTINTNMYDEDLFLVVWGPTVAALSYVYDNGLDKSVVQKALTGFRKCAVISARYGLSEVFDNLVISLCKFTTLLTQGEPSDNLPVTFGTNIKAQLSARTAFSLAHRHGDILREGWQNLLVCILQLFKTKLLPTVLTEVEDFIDQSGKISLIREEPQPTPRPDTTGILSSFYHYILANPDTSYQRVQSAEDIEAQQQATNCIQDCHPELLITESKFLRGESLQEFVKALVFSSKPENAVESSDVPFDEDAATFFLEFLIRVALQNKDRISILWQTVRDHLTSIIISAQKSSFLVERAVIGLLRLAIRLIRREDISSQVLVTLRVLLMMRPAVLQACYRQIAYGVHELIRTNANNINLSRDWVTILTLLEVAGAGAQPPTVKPGPSLTMVHGESPVLEQEQIEEETGEKTFRSVQGASEDNAPEQSGETWLLINQGQQEDQPLNQYNLEFGEKLGKHDCRAFIKASGTIGFIVRDAAHVSQDNILQCIHTSLLFTEASANGGVKLRLEDPAPKEANTASVKRQQAGKGFKKSRKKGHKYGKTKNDPPGSPISEDDVEINESTSNIYDAISLQLLDLMYLLHTKASSILANVDWHVFQERQRQEVRQRWSSIESVDKLPSTFTGDADFGMSLLWIKCWCPLLQGIARLCCDNRKEIRMSALTILQRSLLAEDLQTLTATEWESCFNKVLFPMLARLLEVPSDVDPIGLEETRMRAATLLCKAFLKLLNTLLTLSTFTALWMTILDFMDRYMKADSSDLLSEAIPESMKNMLLVMSTSGVFDRDEDDQSLQLTQKSPVHEHQSETSRHYSALWQVTWERIDCFLPNLKRDMVASRSPFAQRASSPPIHAEPEPQTMDTEGRPVSDDESSKPAQKPQEQEADKVDDVIEKSAEQEQQSPVMGPVRTSLDSHNPASNIVLHSPLPMLNQSQSRQLILSTAGPQTPGMPIILAPRPPLDKESNSGGRPDNLPLKMTSTEITGQVIEKEAASLSTQSAGEEPASLAINAEMSIVLKEQSSLQSQRGSSGGSSWGQQTLQNNDGNQDSAVKTVQIMKQEMELWKKSKMWPFSCFSHQKEKPCIIGLTDYSPEEVRLEAYKAKETGSMSQYLNVIQQYKNQWMTRLAELTNLNTSAWEQELRKAAAGTNGTSLFQSNVKQTGLFSSSSSLFSNQQTEKKPINGLFSSGFNQSNTQTAGQSVFGKPATFGAQPSNPFATQTQSPFGSQQSQSLFGHTSTNPEQGQGLFSQSTSNKNIFGQQSFPQPTNQTSGGLFSQSTNQNTGLFNQPANQNSSGLFSQQTASAVPSQGLFSSQPTQGLFSASSANQSNPFGQKQPTMQQPSNSTFGNSTQSQASNPSATSSVQVNPFLQASVQQSANTVAEVASTLPLTEKDIAAFKADRFIYGEIPEGPPPLELC